MATMSKSVDTLIFIDSNIYLRFYDTKQSNFKQLLKSLIQLKDRIFVTRQIADEVYRNKCQIFEQTFSNYLKQISQGLQNVQLPEHLDIEKNEKIKEWNKRREKVKEQNDILIKELKAIYKSIFFQIVTSNDDVSKGLSEVFKFAKVETEEELENAFRRKKIGNPPGKNNDSVGDQINWQQLLNNVANINKLIIVSNDYDYFVEIEDELMLNPLLKQELLAVNPRLNIACFNKLSNGLKSINEYNTGNPFKLPKTSVLEQIILEEPELHLSQQSFEDANDSSLIYYNENYKLIDELSRLNYMYRHAMLTTDELRRRLRKLGANENKIAKIVSSGNIPFTNTDFFLDFF
jgi:hypothetical protein